MKMLNVYKNDGITIDIAQLSRRLRMSIASFKDEIPMLGEVEEVAGGKYIDYMDSRHFFRDNHSKVLAVAHLDTAIWLDESVSVMYNKVPLVISPQLDDRMGVYILLDVLPKLGIKPDILLTVGEEMCASTAANFETTKKYNWGFSFDRRGDDVVTYQFGNKNWKTAIEAADFHIGIGSYSDIRELDTLGCSFMNIGCGYDSEHTDFCRADLRETTEQIAKFVEFYNTFNDIRFPHVRDASSNYGGGSRWAQYNYGRNSWGDEDYPYVRTAYATPHVKVHSFCIHCGTELTPDEIDDGVCAVCVEYEGNKRIQFEAGGEKYVKEEGGGVYNGNEDEVCAKCLCTLHEGESGICDECWEEAYEKTKLASKGEVEDD
jgi:hypothetical protein